MARRAINENLVSNAAAGTHVIGIVKTNERMVIRIDSMSGDIVGVMMGELFISKTRHDPIYPFVIEPEQPIAIVKGDGPASFVISGFGEDDRYFDITNESPRLSPQYQQP